MKYLQVSESSILNPKCSILKDDNVSQYGYDSGYGFWLRSESEHPNGLNYVLFVVSGTRIFFVSTCQS